MYEKTPKKRKNPAAEMLRKRDKANLYALKALIIKVFYKVKR